MPDQVGSRRFPGPGTVVPGGGLDAGDVLPALAADEGSDLVVMGGYGHARLRERVLGGATRTMLERTTVPVLLSH